MQGADLDVGVQITAIAEFENKIQLGARFNDLPGVGEERGSEGD